ncbi:hypothetical protein APC69_05075 [Acinetobacter baumannii]|nr:hypothetical protein APC69_05075 [Acinetobacter baumannii]RCU22589.1 hypothetical protein DVA80_20130 [Acinetobacter baumannii]
MLLVSIELFFQIVFGALLIYRLIATGLENCLKKNCLKKNCLKKNCLGKCLKINALVCLGILG